jgi:hypothetical protein
MRRITIMIIALLIQFSDSVATAAELSYSAKSDIWENPFLAYGYNPKTKLLTGYLAALRTAPGRTDECKLAFSRSIKTPNALSVRYIGEAEAEKQPVRTSSGVLIVQEKNEFYLRLYKPLLGGDCNWILPFVVGARVRETADDIIIPMKYPNVGNWIGVNVVNAKRAKFHSQPDAALVQKAFLVEGDVIYVYEERPDWYFVRFEEGKKKTIGWIKKSDTVQP